MNIVSVNDLAHLVKQERKRRGWTQAQLAERSGVSRDWIINLEKAKPSVELTLVLRTLKTLQLPVSVGTPSPPQDSNAPDINLDELLAKNTSSLYSHEN